jgi:protein-tyrosine phosphatase
MFNKAIYNTIGFFRHKKSVQIFNAIMKAENSNIIVEKLYLGNIIDAHNLSFLVNNNINAIINCTDNEPFHQYFIMNDDNDDNNDDDNDDFNDNTVNNDTLNDNTFNSNTLNNDTVNDDNNKNENKNKNEKYILRLDIKDSKDEENIEKFMNIIDDGVEFINTHKNLNNKTVFVHCYWGLMRSATVIAGYLIKYENYSVDNAIELIKNKRSYTFSNLYNFKDILESYQEKIFKDDLLH